MNQFFLLILNHLNIKRITGKTYNIDEKMTEDDGNEVDNPKYDANKVGKNETEVVIPLKKLSNSRKNLNIPHIVN